MAESDRSTGLAEDGAVTQRARTVRIVLPAGLTPADAAAMAGEMRSGLAEVAASGQPLRLDLDGGNPGPVAVQLLVALMRSAEAGGVDLRRDRSARAAADRFDQPVAFGGSG